VNGTPYLFAVYGCTPLVRFALSTLKDGAHVHGDVLGELGYGANPLDMLTFTSPADSKDYLLVTIDTRSASQNRSLRSSICAATADWWRIDFGPGGLGRTQRALPIKAEHMAILNSKWAVVIWRHPRTTYRLDLSNWRCRTSSNAKRPRAFSSGRRGRHDGSADPLDQASARPKPPFDSMPPVIQLWQVSNREKPSFTTIGLAR
jgi:hypothetical protein